MSKKNFKYLVFILILGVSLSYSAAALAAIAGSKPSAPPSSIKMHSEDDREITWNLNADRMITESGGSIIEAFGKVELKMGADYIRADFARYFANTNWVYLYGNIQARMDEDSLEAQEAEFDLRSRTGWLHDGHIFIAANNTHLAADRIIKHRNGTYSFSGLKYTTCDGETPAWSLEADTGVLEMGGYVQLWKTKFQIADQAIMYSPYLIVPAKSSRQSGFLIPDIGHSSRFGYFFTQPFYWVIDDSRDMTFTESYMRERGFMHGLNYRSRDSEDENLWLSFDYLYDRQSITSDAHDKYYPHDGLVRENKSRYWLRGMYDARLPGYQLWRFRADVDYVSDPYYLRDFSRGMQGFDKNRAAMFETFSRDPRERDQHRQSGAMLFRDWDRAGIYLSGMHYQNQNLGNGNTPRSRDTVVQHLPALNLYLQQGRIFDALPLEFSGSGQAGYFYRREGTSGTRFDLSPSLTLPVRGRYGSITGRAGLHGTWYRTEKRDISAVPGGSSSDEKSRYIPEFELDASTEFSRVYQLSGVPLRRAGESRWVGLKHSVTPRLGYLYVHDRDQSTTPYFTSYDYLAPRQEILWGLDNVITRKRERKLERIDEKTKESETYSQYDYQDVVRLSLEHAYSLYEAGRDHDLQYRREPWRDLMAELTVYWNDHLSFVSSNYWTPSEDKVTRHSQGVRVTVPQGTISASLDHRKPVHDYYSQISRNSITNDFTALSLATDMRIWGPWSASAYYDWDIHGESKNEKGLSLMYHHSCFNIGGQIIRNEMDTIFQLQFSLSGLGS